MYVGEKHCGFQRSPTNCYVRGLLRCATAILLITNTAYAQVSIQLPSTINSGARDRIVTPERFECENSLSGKAQIEYGVAASNAQRDNVFNTNPADQGRALTVYGKLIVPIGGPKSRIDCNQLYELELRRRQLEIKILEQQLKPEVAGFRTEAVPNQQVQNPSSGTSATAR
jgi:hypothetical protein